MTGKKKTATCPSCETEWHVDMNMVKERVLICPNCKRVDFVEYFVDRDRTLKKEKKPATSKVPQKGSSATEEKSSTPEVNLKPRQKRVKKSEEAPLSLTSDCFIVTATYGTKSYEKLSIFYGFRDEFLLKRPWGIAFTRTYYVIGPFLAMLIRRSETLRRISRFFLDQIASVIKKNP